MREHIQSRVIRLDFSKISKQSSFEQKNRLTDSILRFNKVLVLRHKPNRIINIETLNNFLVQNRNTFKFQMIFSIIIITIELFESKILFLDA